MDEGIALSDVLSSPSLLQLSGPKIRLNSSRTADSPLQFKTVLPQCIPIDTTRSDTG